MRITTRMLRGYYKAASDDTVFGGIGFNDAYNREKYNITHEEYCAVKRREVDVFGLCKNGRKLTLKTANA
jgi:hypothetical protein